MENGRINVEPRNERIDSGSLGQQKIRDLELAVDAGEIEGLVEDILPSPLATERRLSIELALESVGVRQSARARPQRAIGIEPVADGLEAAQTGREAKVDLRATCRQQRGNLPKGEVDGVSQRNTISVDSIDGRAS